MARIPLDIARRRLETGTIPRYPQGGGPAGAAVEALGAGISELAARVQDTTRRHEAFDAALREQEFLEELAQAESEALVRSPPDGEGLHDAVYAMPAGGTGRNGSVFDAIFERHAARFPESRRTIFEASREQHRLAGSTRLAAVQLDRRRQHETAAFARIRETLLAGIRGGGAPDAASFDAARRKGLELIDNMSADGPTRSALSHAWDRDATLAGLEARLGQDPGFAAKARALLAAHPD